MTTLIETLLTKLGLRDEARMLAKTNELVRLLELRSSNTPLPINEYGKIVICADIAASLLGTQFDKVQALSLSGLRKTHYANNKRMFEKILDLNKLVGVRDICLQINLNEVSKKAEELLELYRKVIVSEQSTDVDISHPQYAAMAVFMACKLRKQKVTKSKVIPFSNLRPSQWQQLEQRWEKFIAKHYNDSIDKKLKQLNYENHTAGATSGSLEKSSNNIKTHTEIEDYEKWKTRMLTIAQSKLNERERDAVNLDFTDVIDDMIFGC